MCTCVRLPICVQLFMTPWMVAQKAPLVHGIFQARILEWVAIFLLQRFFPTQGWNLSLLHLLHWQQIVYH